MSQVPHIYTKTLAHLCQQITINPNEAEKIVFSNTLQNQMNFSAGSECEPKPQSSELANFYKPEDNLVSWLQFHDAKRIQFRLDGFQFEILSS